jgi:hypothetical protein
VVSPDAAWHVSAGFRRAWHVSAGFRRHSPRCRLVRSPRVLAAAWGRAPVLISRRGSTAAAPPVRRTAFLCLSARLQAPGSRPQVGREEGLVSPRLPQVRCVCRHRACCVYCPSARHVVLFTSPARLPPLPPLFPISAPRACRRTEGRDAPPPRLAPWLSGVLAKGASHNSIVLPGDAEWLGLRSSVLYVRHSTTFCGSGCWEAASHTTPPSSSAPQGVSCRLPRLGVRPSRR